MKPSERAKIPRQVMPELPPRYRARSFEEVPLGYSEEQARLEAARCLKCRRPRCVDGCPVEVPVPQFVELVEKGDFLAAARKVKEANGLPAVCGRVCPQEVQCEGNCVLGRKGDPVAIGNLERFVADYERRAQVVAPRCASSGGKRVAVVGSGPSGLTVAKELLTLGHHVEVFEAFHEPGGVLTYGIPEFRLPKRVVKAEVDFLRSLGLVVHLHHVVGRTTTISELLEKFDAVFLGVGAGLPWFLGVEGENLKGVFSANEYLTRTNLMRAYRFPEYDTPILSGERVAVIGGGNVAMDAARTAARLGARKVTVVYRRSAAELPARRAEVHHAREEGIRFRLLSSPTRFEGNSDGWVERMRCVRMRLGEPDESGRRRPLPVEGSEFSIPTDLVVVAIGTSANPLLTRSVPGLELDRRGHVKTDPWGRTSIPRVYAGGDVVTGSATVISAMGAGRRAARAIHEDLTGGTCEDGPSVA
ncbi:MAG: NADPH-dependent glutamate synthase [Promethearchaeota archaeon]